VGRPLTAALKKVKARTPKQKKPRLKRPPQPTAPEHPAALPLLSPLNLESLRKQQVSKITSFLRLKKIQESKVLVKLKFICSPTQHVPKRSGSMLSNQVSKQVLQQVQDSFRHSQLICENLDTTAKLGTVRNSFVLSQPEEPRANHFRVGKHRSSQLLEEQRVRFQRKQVANLKSSKRKRRDEEDEWDLIKVSQVQLSGSRPSSPRRQVRLPLSCKQAPPQQHSQVSLHTKFISEAPSKTQGSCASLVPKSVGVDPMESSAPASCTQKHTKKQVYLFQQSGFGSPLNNLDLSPLLELTFFEEQKALKPTLQIQTDLPLESPPVRPLTQRPHSKYSKAHSLL